MAYEDALEWLTENVPIEMYDSYADWYNACQAEITTPSLWGSATFNRMHEQYWRDNKIAEQEPEPIPISEVVEEKIEISKRPPSSYREPEESIDTEVIFMEHTPIGLDFEDRSVVPREFPPLEERTIPKTESAPIISRVRFNFTQVSIPSTAGFRNTVKRTIIDVLSFFRRK